MTSPADDDTNRRKPLGVVALLVALVVIVIVALIALFADDDDDEVVVGTTTTAVEPDGATTTTDTTEPAATTTADAATTTPTGVVDTATAVFPFASDDTRFDDPLEAAEAWAEGYVGFVDPVYSEFREGDSRSGEVEVRPSQDGPATTVFLRQLDDTWWVLGSVAETIEVSEPEALDEITSPLPLRGEASSPQGTLDIELWTDAADEPLAMTTATVDADQLTAFEATLEWERPPQTRTGGLYLRTRDAETGAVHGATVLRVHFSDT